MKMAEEETGQGNAKEIFNIENPEGQFDLNLAVVYDQIVLRDLLSLSEQLVASSVENGTPFE
jgi:hypothetical protein